MNNDEYNRAKTAINSVTLARLAAFTIAVPMAWRGDWLGVFIMFSCIMLLHFALPVIPDDNGKR